MKTLDRIDPPDLIDPLDPLYPLYPIGPMTPISEEEPATKTYPPRESLNEVGRSLLDDAEVRVILETVARDFPHLVNRISAVWSEPSRCVRLIDELLLNDRPERKGFPLIAVLELSTLRNHYVERVAPLMRVGRKSPGLSSLGEPNARPNGFFARVGALFRF